MNRIERRIERAGDGQYEAQGVGADAGGSPMGSEPHEGAKKASMAGTSDDCARPRRGAEWHTWTVEVGLDFLHNFLQIPV